MYVASIVPRGTRPLSQKFLTGFLCFSRLSGWCCSCDVSVCAAPPVRWLHVMAWGQRWRIANNKTGLTTKFISVFRKNNWPDFLGTYVPYLRKRLFRGALLSGHLSLPRRLPPTYLEAGAGTISVGGGNLAACRAMPPRRDQRNGGRRLWIRVQLAAESTNRRC